MNEIDLIIEQQKIVSSLQGVVSDLQSNVLELASVVRGLQQRVKHLEATKHPIGIEMPRLQAAYAAKEN